MLLALFSGASSYNGGSKVKYCPGPEITADK